MLVASTSAPSRRVSARRSRRSAQAIPRHEPACSAAAKVVRSAGCSQPSSQGSSASCAEELTG
jgi:hypothetical protein